jgi:hypothetical protein
MEAITNREGTKGIMISGDEIDHLIIRDDRKIDLYLKPTGRWTFKIIDGVQGDSNSTFHVGPPEELYEKRRQEP